MVYIFPITEAEKKIMITAMAQLANQYKEAADFYDSIPDGEPRISCGTNWRLKEEQAREIINKLKK